MFVCEYGLGKLLRSGISYSFVLDWFWRDVGCIKLGWTGSFGLALLTLRPSRNGGESLLCFEYRRFHKCKELERHQTVGLKAFMECKGSFPGTTFSKSEVASRFNKASSL